MASRAVARVNCDWSKLTSQMSQSDLPKLNKLKSRIDSTGVKVSSLPETLPKIDWAYYKAHASNPKLVEEIEKKYSQVKLDRPKAPANRWSDLDLAHQQDLRRYEKFSEIAKSYVEAASIVKEKFENMIPVKDMTLEDFTLTFPHWSFTPENPSIYPHYGRAIGISREEAAALDQPDPLPYANKQAWKDWETKYKKFYE